MQEGQVFQGLAAFVLLAGPPVEAATPRSMTPLAAVPAPYAPVFGAPRHLGRAFTALPGVHSARRGELVVPARAYASRLQTVDTRDVGSDKIYDIAFLGLDRDGIMLEVRGYSGGDLTNPKVSRTASFPADAKTIQIRHVLIAIKSANALGMTYSATIAPIAANVVADDRAGETPVVEFDYCQGRGVNIDVPVNTR